METDRWTKVLPKGYFVDDTFFIGHKVSTKQKSKVELWNMKEWTNYHIKPPLDKGEKKQMEKHPEDKQ